jgi:hypothetical protein
VRRAGRRNQRGEAGLGSGLGSRIGRTAAWRLAAGGWRLAPIIQNHPDTAGRPRHRENNHNPLVAAPFNHRPQQADPQTQDERN